MNWQQQHANALAAVKRAKAVLTTFTRKGIATENSDGSVTNAPSTTVQLWCISDPTSGDVAAFQALSLVNASAKRLFGINAVFGERVLQGDTCIWNAQPLTVQNVQDLDTLGPSIGAYATVIA